MQRGIAVAETGEILFQQPSLRSAHLSLTAPSIVSYQPLLRRSLRIMRPHSYDLHGLDIVQNLIDEAVLYVDSPGIGT